MKEYEDSHYQKWLEVVDSTLIGLMKRSVLAKATPPPPPVREEDVPEAATPTVSPTKGVLAAVPLTHSTSELESVPQGRGTYSGALSLWPALHSCTCGTSVCEVH